MSAAVVVLIVFWTLAVVLTAMQWTSPRWAPCDCGRTRRWAFRAGHERHWSFVVQAVLITALTVMTALGLSSSTPMWVGITIFGWWRVKVHGSGKRRWPKRLAGLVEVNQHGRLVVAR